MTLYTRRTLHASATTRGGRADEARTGKRRVKLTILELLCFDTIWGPENPADMVADQDGMFTVWKLEHWWYMDRARE